MNIVTLSSKNQITLPVALLQLFGIQPKSRLIVQAKDDVIVMKPIKKSVVEETAGILSKYVPASKRGVAWKTIMEETKKIVAKELAEEA